MSKILQFPQSKKQLVIDPIGRKIYAPDRNFEKAAQKSIDRIRKSMKELNELMLRLKQQNKGEENE